MKLENNVEVSVSVKLDSAEVLALERALILALSEIRDDERRMAYSKEDLREARDICETLIEYIQKVTRVKDDKAT